MGMVMRTRESGGSRIQAGWESRGSRGSRAEPEGHPWGAGPAGSATGEAKGPSLSLATRETNKKEGQGKTDLEGRNLHTVAKADGA